MNAKDLLAQAAVHMEKRANQYDKPEGERSVPAVVDAFNAIKGGDRMLSHADGWLFLTLLKLVRGQTAKGQAATDSAEDAVAYAALFGEELLRANEPHRVGAIVGAAAGPGPDGWQALRNAQARADLDAMPIRSIKRGQCTHQHKQGDCFKGQPCDCDPMGQR